MHDRRSGLRSYAGLEPYCPRAFTYSAFRVPAGLSRNTAREYARAAETAGITRERALTAEEWAGFVRERFPETESAVARAVWWVELARHRAKIVQRLGENRVTTVWERMREEGKVEASLSTFRRYVTRRSPRLWTHSGWSSTGWTASRVNWRRWTSGGWAGEWIR